MPKHDIKPDYAVVVYKPATAMTLDEVFRFCMKADDIISFSDNKGISVRFTKTCAILMMRRLSERIALLSQEGVLACAENINIAYSLSLWCATFSKALYHNQHCSQTRIEHAA